MAGENGAQKVGENVTIEETDKEVVLRFDKEYRGDFNGKTIRVASTRGNKEVGETGIIVGLNAYVYPEKKQK